MISARLILPNAVSNDFWVFSRAFSSASLILQLTTQLFCSFYAWMENALGASTAR